MARWVMIHEVSLAILSLTWHSPSHTSHLSLTLSSVRYWANPNQHQWHGTARAHSSVACGSRKHGGRVAFEPWCLLGTCLRLSAPSSSVCALPPPPAPAPPSDGGTPGSSRTVTTHPTPKETYNSLAQWKTHRDANVLLDFRLAPLQLCLGLRRTSQ